MENTDRGSHTHGWRNFWHLFSALSAILQGSILLLSLVAGFLSVVGGITSVIWLSCLGQWSPIGFGFLSVLGSTFLIGLVLMPADLLASPCERAFERGHRFIGVILGALASLYIVTIVVAWGYFILDSFVLMATPKSLFPVLLCSYAVATAPWAFLAQREQRGGGGNPASFVHVLFLSIGYIISALAVWLWGATLQTCLVILASTMGASYGVCLLLFFYSTFGKPKAVNTNDVGAAFVESIVEPLERANAAGACLDVGSRHRAEGNLDDAITSYQQAIKLRADYFPAWFSLAETYAVQGRYEDAAEAYRRFIKLKPDHADAWRNLGEVYAKQGKRIEALDALDHLRTLDPSQAAKLAEFLSPK